jgi:hypothetical protein
VRRHLTTKLVAIGSVVLLAMGITGAAGASIGQAEVVLENPANFTPRVITGTAVYKLLQVGTRMFAGGDFSQVQEDSGPTYNRSNLFSFSVPPPGTVNPHFVVNPLFAPTFDAPVWGLAASGNSLWVGGNFKTVNGVARRGLVKLVLDPVTGAGAVDMSFNAHLNGNVEDLQLINGRLIVGGKFAKRLQAVNPITGAEDTDYLNLVISGTVAANAGATDVYRFAVNPTGTRLVAIGNFTTVGGVAHPRAFMVNLDPTGMTPGTLSSWNYAPLSKACRAPKLPAQLRDVDFSPDGSFFVIVATGYIPNTPAEQDLNICDAAAAFLTPDLSPAKPFWINSTGGDTLHSVAVTTHAVYIQGHMRWVGSTGIGCTPGCSERMGIAALDPANGKALEDWNPGKTRGVGGKDLLLTDAGLWVASDGARIGGELHQDLAFLPLP